MTTPAPPVTELPMPHLDGVEHRYATVDGLRVHYAEAGEGDPVVLLHGWPQHWWCWRELIGPLAERFRVIVPDYRGLGWTDTPGGDYTRQRLEADFVGLLDVLGIERAHVVGQDWGLVTGYGAAIWHSHRVERVVVMAGLYPWAPDGSPPRIWLRPWHIYVLAAGGRHAVTRLGVPEIALRTWRQAGEFTPEEIEIYTAPLRRPGSAMATVLRYRAIMVRDIPFIFRHYRELEVKVPLLHLNGERDPLVHKLPDTWRRHTGPDYSLELVPGAGHFPHEERPEWVADRVLDFLQ